VLAHFGSVLLDEASQAVEPSSLIGALFGCEQLFLVGDPCQLPPTVISAGAARGGLGITLFDRLSSAGLPPLLLNTQYRMHPEIARFPSEFFYNGKLLSGVNGTARPRPLGFAWPAVNSPVAFVSVSGQERREAADEGGSISNAPEARMAAKLVTEIVAAGEAPSGIGVITPYAAQVTANLPSPRNPLPSFA
jgi:regulator of nonsense transcripts 1